MGGLGYRMKATMKDLRLIVSHDGRSRLYTKGMIVGIRGLLISCCMPRPDAFVCTGGFAADICKL